MPRPAILKFDDATTPVEESTVPVDKRIAGNPRQRVWNHYADPSGKFCSGIWESEPGTWRIDYTEEEYCELLGGISILTDEHGRAVTVRAGERFVIPRGYKGTWQVVETTRKVYVIYEVGAAPGTAAQMEGGA